MSLNAFEAMDRWMRLGGREEVQGMNILVYSVAFVLRVAENKLVSF